jgi:hypothetical protein
MCIAIRFKKVENVTNLTQYSITPLSQLMACMLIKLVVMKVFSAPTIRLSIMASLFLLIQVGMHFLIINMWLTIYVWCKIKNYDQFRFIYVQVMGTAILMDMLSKVPTLCRVSLCFVSCVRLFQHWIRWQMFVEFRFSYCNLWPYLIH